MAFPEFKYKTDRIIGLDILRSFAILIVLYGHGIVSLKNIRVPEVLSKMHFIDGVTVFFVLSGFLIGNMLFELIKKEEFCSAKHLIKFWQRRWFRTLPNYYFVLYILLILGMITRSPDLVNLDWRYLFFLQNISWPHPNFFKVAWSLSVEEWFYLVIPLIFFFLSRVFKDGNKWAYFRILLILCFVPFFLRVMYYFNGAGAIENIKVEYLQTVILRFDCIIYGLFGAFLKCFYFEAWRKYKMFFLLLGLFLCGIKMICLDPGSGQRYDLIFVNMLESFLVFLWLPYFSELKKIGPGIVEKFFIHISVISYSMYLIHNAIVLKYIMPGLDRLAGIQAIPPFVLFPVYLIVTVMASYLLYSCFEKPVMDIRDRINN